MDECKLIIILEDKPGELSRSLDIIAKHKANLFSVSHLREKAKSGKIPVVVRLEAEEDALEGIVTDFQNSGIEVTEKKFGKSGSTRVSKEFVIIGHIVDTDIRDTIHAICGKGVIIRSLEIGMKSLTDPSSAFVGISAETKEDLARAMENLDKVAEKKGLTIIPSIEE